MEEMTRKAQKSLESKPSRELGGVGGRKGLWATRTFVREPRAWDKAHSEAYGGQHTTLGQLCGPSDQDGWKT